MIFVGLLDFEVFPSAAKDGGRDYHSLHRILDVRDRRWEMKGMEFHFLELPKLGQAAELTHGDPLGAGRRSAGRLRV